MTLPTVYVDVDFTGGDHEVFTVGHPVLGRVGMNPIGPEDIWTDVSQYVRRWSVKRGASDGDQPTMRLGPGTCSIQFNDGDRRFDPSNAAGPYVVAGETQVVPERRVRIRASWGFGSWSIFVGYVDNWQPEYVGNQWTYSNMTATDASKVLARPSREALAPAFAGDDSGTRTNRILDSAGWSAGDRNIAVGDTTLQATTLEGSPLTELYLVADTEQGEFYIDGAGAPNFRNRTAILTDTRSAVSQVTFGDGGFMATGEIPMADATQSTPADTLVNYVRAARAGGTEQIAQDVVSVARFGQKPHTRDDLLMETDDIALQWANWLKYQYAQPARRFARVEFNTPAPQVEDAYWSSFFPREFGDRITVIRRPAGGGDPIERDCFVRGIEHESDGASWTTALVLQGAERSSFFVVGDPILGRAGLNAISY